MVVSFIDDVCVKIPWHEINEINNFNAVCCSVKLFYCSDCNVYNSCIGGQLNEIFFPFGSL